MQTIQEKFEIARSRYFEIKKLSESNIFRWEWTTQAYYKLEPYWHERAGLPKGRKLKKEPLKKNGCYQYGFDEKGRVYIVRTWIDLYGKEVYYEEFYVYSENLLEQFYFDYFSEKNLIRMSELRFEKSGRLVATESFNARGDYIEKNFYFEGNQLIEIVRKQLKYGNRQTFERIKERFFYNEDGELNIIKSYGSHIERVIYQRKPKGENIDKTIKRVQGELIDLIPKIIEKQSIKETVYSIIIVYSYGASDYFPPSLAIGIEDDMKSLINQNDVEEIWNPSECKYMLDLHQEISQELEEQINVLNTFFNQKNEIKQLEKIYNNIAKELNSYNWSKIIGITDNFVLFALEINNFSKFKRYLKSAISKEKFDKLKSKDYF